MFIKPKHFLIATLLFIGCKKDNSSSSNMVKKGDVIEYKFIGSSTIPGTSYPAYFTYLYSNASEAVVTDDFATASSAYRKFTAFKDGQKVGFSVMSISLINKIEAQLLINGKVVKSGTFGDGVTSLTIEYQ